MKNVCTPRNKKITSAKVQGRKTKSTLEVVYFNVRGPIQVESTRGNYERIFDVILAIYFNRFSRV